MSDSMYRLAPCPNCRADVSIFQQPSSVGGEAMTQLATCGGCGAQVTRPHPDENAEWKLQEEFRLPFAKENLDKAARAKHCEPRVTNLQSGSWEGFLIYGSTGNKVAGTVKGRTEAEVIEKLLVLVEGAKTDH